MRLIRTFGSYAVVATIALAGCDQGSDQERETEGSQSASDETTGVVETPRPPPDCTADAASTLYNRRIAPLLDDDRPSSCNRCHLSGIDLAQYIQTDACSTMVCMHSKGLVDFDEPSGSKVLDWISRGAPDSPGITEAIIEEEHDAMLEWIEFYSACGTELCEVPDGDDACGEAPTYKDCEVPQQSGGSKPFDDPGDCDPVTLESMFAAKVYAWRGRCGPCHYANVETGLEAPRWIDLGSCDLASLESLRNVVDAGYLDADDPAKSLLLTKPLSEDLGGVEHGGHGKFHALDDPAYLDMLAWIERWSSCQTQ